MVNRPRDKSHASVPFNGVTVCGLCGGQGPIFCVALSCVLNKWIPGHPPFVARRCIVLRMEGIEERLLGLQQLWHGRNSWMSSFYWKRTCRQHFQQNKTDLLRSDCWGSSSNYAMEERVKCRHQFFKKRTCLQHCQQITNLQFTGLFKLSLIRSSTRRCLWFLV